jgi:hypothetical protein
MFRVLESKHPVMLQKNPFRRGVQALTIGIKTGVLHWWSPIIQWVER